jgi:predicted unusual protein kinase regulating ubiquinone biosynthesis (AarF/ABC1/UbiB family)
MPVDAAGVVAAENGSAKDALLIVSGIAAGSLVITYYLQEGNRVQDFPSLLAAGFRIFRLVSTAIIVSADYGWVIFQTRGVETELDRAAKELRASNDEFTDLLRRKEHGEAVPTELLDKARERVALGGSRMAELMSDPKNSVYHEVHLRSAARLKDMCVKNKGVYIKLGQHLSQLDYLVPSEFVDTLRSLLANNPTSSIESVRKTIKEDFGAFPEELWAKFDEKPIASASLAQVHVAYGHDGKKYAVKVQHEGLFESSGADMRAITDVVTTASRLFRDFNYEWLCREVNRNMPQELDFRTEARNIAKAKALLSCDDVAVPTVVRASNRVLCMSFEEGCYVTDNEKIDEMKLDRASIARIISETFSDQT